MITDFFRKARNRIRFKGLTLHPSTRFTGKGKFEFGRNCGIAENVVFVLNGSLKIGDKVSILNGSEFDAGEITIGSDTSIQRNTRIFGDVKIGSYNVLGPNLYISSGAHEFRAIPGLNIRDQDDLAARNGKPGEKVSIGDDCWFGINVVVMPGVTVGKGCVVGANSVVTRDVPPYSVIGGVPAKIISKRLEFIPPQEITPSDAGVPYLYEGFKTRVSERAGGALRLSGSNFSVSLKTQGASKLVFLVEGVKKFWSGTEPFVVTNGRVEIPVRSLLGDGIAIPFSCGGEDWWKARITRIWTE